MYQKPGTGYQGWFRKRRLAWSNILIIVDDCSRFCQLIKPIVPLGKKFIIQHSEAGFCARVMSLRMTNNRNRIHPEGWANERRSFTEHKTKTAQLEVHWLLNFDFGVRLD